MIENSENSVVQIPKAKGELVAGDSINQSAGSCLNA
jgi:hypothetical protein